MKKFSFFFIIITNSLFAQMKPAKSYAIYVNYPKYSVKTFVLNSNKHTRVFDNLTYYWYSSNKIMETQGGFDGKLLDGTFTCFYLSNSLKEKGRFRKGVKIGEWISWYENGKIHEIEAWKKGIKNGTFKTYNEKGELLKTWKVKPYRYYASEGDSRNEKTKTKGKSIIEKRVAKKETQLKKTPKIDTVKKDTINSDPNKKLKSFLKSTEKPAKSIDQKPPVASEKKAKKEGRKKTKTEISQPVKK